jgi:hypothetical protein
MLDLVDFPCGPLRHGDLNNTHGDDFRRFPLGDIRFPKP